MGATQSFIIFVIGCERRYLRRFASLIPSGKRSIHVRELNPAAKLSNWEPQRLIFMGLDSSRLTDNCDAVLLVKRNQASRRN